jgi:hypothetical protein
MPPAAPVRFRPLVWVAGFTLLVAGCGRVGYDRVSLADGSPAQPDAPADVVRDVPGPAPDAFLSDAVSPDLGLPDAPRDALAKPPDTEPPDAPLADTSPADRSVDRPPDLPPDAAPPPVPPVFASASAVAGASDTQLASMFDAGTGSNRYLLVGIAVETESRNVTAVSFGGRALTRLGGNTAGACGTFLYGLPNPPSGSQSLAVSLTGTTDIVVVAASFTGVRQTAGQDGFFATSAIEGPISLLVPSAPGDLVVDIVCLDQVSESPRVGPGQTERGRQVASSFEGVMSTEPGGASVTMSWLSGGATGAWASGAVSLNPAATMAVRLQRRQLFAFAFDGYTNRPGSGPVVPEPKPSAPPPNRL